MSVKQVTTGSIVPASTSERTSSRVSMPLAAPSIVGRMTSVTIAPFLRAGCRMRRRFLDGWAELELVDRPHRPCVLVLRRDDPPDPDEQPDDQDERRVV